MTLAVLPSGLDRIYPRSHTGLARRIIEAKGLLVSEYAAGSEPRREHFIARNRIIAALAEGVLITEAAVASGSLHTARFALELGIPVLAVPGPITSPTSEGTNNLIKAGAVPVTSVADIFSALMWRDTAETADEIRANSEEERVVIELLRAGVSDGHELLQRSGLEAARFHQSLTMLEITGRISALGNNHWALR
jgi:DNA processing protein